MRLHSAAAIKLIEDLNNASGIPPHILRQAKAVENLILDAENPLDKAIPEWQLVELAFHTIAIAERTFYEAGCPNDFCIQALGRNIVFGGTNRLILSDTGWHIDEGYCTPKFIEAFYKSPTNST